MRRREWLQTTVVSALAAIPARRLLGSPDPLPGGAATEGDVLAPPAGSIPVAFLLSEGAVVIDFCGPWEVFQDVAVPGRHGSAFELYTVAETRAPLRASGGLTITPEYTFETAPPPKVVVIPAQDGAEEAALRWIRRVSRTAELTMSVCTGAFVLARTGLLAGKAATTHHSGFKSFAKEFPDVHLKKGARFVEEGSLATAGGLSSGIDLALRVVERYFGRGVAEATADQMEYQGRGWTDPGSNARYAEERVSTEAHTLCPVCDMEVDRSIAPTSTYKGKSYYFCSGEHKEQFDKSPESYIGPSK